MFYIQAINSPLNDSDIDECSADPSPCDADADCTNSEGSYSCACKQGFTGDGISCQGTGESCYYSFKHALSIINIYTVSHKINTHPTASFKTIDFSFSKSCTYTNVIFHCRQKLIKLIWTKSVKEMEIIVLGVLWNWVL